MNLRRYRLLSQLGAGADGVAYRAEDTDSGSLVEVRVLAGARADEERWKLLAKRLRLAAMLEHPGAVSITELSLDHDPPYLALEELPERTLADNWTASRPAPVPTAIRLGRDLADVLAAAHRLGLAHGQLQPDTVRLTAAGDPKIDCTGIRAGVFADPEGSPATGDALADVRSLADLLRWLLDGEPLPSSLQELLGAMCAGEPADRPLARAVAERLGALLNTEEPVAAAATVVPGDARTDARGRAAGPRAAASSFAQTIAAEQAPHERLGRFRLLEKLGEGGLGEVYRAEDLSDGSLAAIKVLRPQWANVPGALKRFHKEARLLAEVNNPYVANLLEVNEDGDVHYLALEYVAGKSLAQFLDEEGTLEERRALTLMADVARALVEPHRNGIVHRDVKPGNILLVEGGGWRVEGKDEATLHPPPFTRVKLCDFGLARHIVESASLNLTAPGAAVGTAFYMAPEQCAGTGNVDCRSDVYAMGATLFHLLAGRPPFVAETALALSALHANAPPPPLHPFNPAVSEGTCQVISKALAKSPDARYADAEALLLDLERLLRGEPSSVTIHPQLPPHDPARVLHYQWRLDLDAAPAQLWPYVSNTDRLNRAVGLPAVQHSNQVDPAAGVRRFVQFRKAGVTSAWEEHPFEWIEGRRHGVLRECSQGPFKWLMTVTDLTPRAGGGTTLVHTVDIEPHGWFGKMVAAMEIGFKGRRNVERVYRRMDAFLTGKLGGDPGADPFEEPAALTGAGRRRLQSLLEGLRGRRIDPAVAEALGDFLEHGPPQEVGRIRPLALARRLSVDADQMVAACLHGARDGLLVLLWDLLCPLCRIPSDVKGTLLALGDHGHCPVCNLDFTLDFANSVEMIFRVHPEVRGSDLGTYCIGGPSHSPHVVAQIRVAGGERIDLELALPEGAYRLRGPQLPFTLDFQVQPSAPLTRWHIALSSGLDAALPPFLKPGRQVLVLINDCARELLVRVERAASRTDALTAARASALALFRELFPQEILSPGQLVSVATVTLLLTDLERVDDLYKELGDGAAFSVLHEHFRRVNEAVRAAGGALVKTLDTGVMAAFTDAAVAVRLALDLPALLAPAAAAGPQLRLAVHRGPALAATLNDHLDYFGATVNQARHLPQLGRGGDLILSPAVAADPAVAALLRRRGLESELFRATLPGAPEDLFHRIVVSPRS